MILLDSLTIEKVEEALEVPWGELMRISRQAPKLYRRTLRQIGSKQRMISEPAPALRAIQTRIHERILRPLRPHRSAFTFRPDGVRQAARLHAGRRYHFQGDLKDCFPSIDAERVERAFRFLGSPPATARLLTGLTTRCGELPQGAPSSPGVAEIALRELDVRLAGFAGNEFRYTRRSDDFTFSSNHSIGRRAVGKITRIVQECGFQLHPEKSYVAGPDDRHQMLGLVVNRHPSVPSEYYERVRWQVRLAASGKVQVSAGELRSLRGKAYHIRQISEQRGQRLLDLLSTVEAVE